MILDLSKPPYEIGARRVGCRDGDGEWHADQAYVLVREVTQADWIAYCHAACGPEWPTPAQIRQSSKDRFFEVSTD